MSNMGHGWSNPVRGTDALFGGYIIMTCNIQKVRVQPMGGGMPLACIKNVNMRIKAMGGEAVFGWEWRDDPNAPYYRGKFSHVVWQSPTGELMCVTPKFVGVEGELAIIDWPEWIQFEPDAEAKFEGKSLGTRYIPTDPRVAIACKYMEIGDNHLYQGDLNSARYWTEKANKELKRRGFKYGWAMPESLDPADYIASMLPEGAW